jgi:hypothetical protein
MDMTPGFTLLKTMPYTSLLFLHTIIKEVERTSCFDILFYAIVIFGSDTECFYTITDLLLVPALNRSMGVENLT